MNRPLLILPLLVLAAVLIGAWSLFSRVPDAKAPSTGSSPDPIEVPASPEASLEVELEGPAVADEGQGARAAVEEAQVQVPTSNAAQGTGARVLGRVLGASGEPISGAEVSLGQGMPGGFVLGGRAPEEERPSTVTGEDGRFVLVTDEVGDRELSVEADTYQRSTRRVHLARGYDYPVGDLRLAQGAVVAGVVRTEAGVPVPEAVLELLPPQELGMFVIGGRSGREIARTDAEGRFRSSALPAGGFELRIVHPEHPDHQVAGSTSPEQPADRLEITLPLGVALEGTVPGYQAGQDVVVKAWHETEGQAGFMVDFGGGEGPNFTDVVREGEVQPDGSFRIGGIKPDKDLKVAVAGTEPFTPLRGPVVELKAPASGVVVPMHPPLALSVRAIDAATGKPVTRFRARVRGGGGPMGMGAPGMGFGDEEEHSEGQVLLEDLRLPPGSQGVVVELEAPGYEPWESAPLTLPQEGTLALGDAPLTAGPGVVVELFDRESGEPVADARVGVTLLSNGGRQGGRVRGFSVASSPGDGEMMMTGAGERFLGTRRTDEEGRVHLVAPVKGRVRLRLAHTDYGTRTAEADVVPPRTVVRLPLDRPGTVTVTAVGAEDVPLADVRVEHRGPEAAGGMPMGPGGGGAATDAQGRVRFTGLTPGTHRFRVGKPQAGGMVFFGMNDEAPAEEDWVSLEVEAGGRHELVVRRAALSVVEGRVLLDGEPLAQAKVSFQKDGQEGFWFMGGGGPVATTSAEGEFRLDGLEPAEGRLTVEHPRLQMKLSEPFQVRSGNQRADLSFVLTVVEGRVTDEDGQPVAGARVSARVASDPQVRMVMAFASSDGGGAQVVGDSAPGRTDADGRYRLEGVRTGTDLTVEVEGGGHCPASTTVEALEPGELRADVDFEVLRGAKLVVKYAASGNYSVLATYEGEGPLGESVPPEYLFLAEGEATKDGLTPGIWNLALRTVGREEELVAERTIELLAGSEETVEF